MGGFGVVGDHGGVRGGRGGEVVEVVVVVVVEASGPTRPLPHGTVGRVVSYRIVSYRRVARSCHRYRLHVTCCTLRRSST